jgi:hypothetical protein
MESCRPSGRIVRLQMRFAIGVIFLGGAFVATLQPADARPYNYREQHFLSYHSPWCLRTMSEDSDCGYATFEQCNVSRAGVGGSCDPNPFYQPAPTAHRLRHKAKRIAR